ncbi:hypothetical protein, partial [Streptomyces brasiliscabiei]|uniref:hypothetical protein n=1 Tax=Streptomyces brasiliscabiei TaxID=2736302 RepID=UPI003014F829
EDRFLGWIARSEEGLSPAAPRQLSWLSEMMLGAADPAGAAARRRANWALLASGLADVAPLFSDLPDGVVPLTFPVIVADGRRDALRQHLAA